MTKKLIILLVIVSLSFALFGCLQNDETSIVSISLAETSIKEIYDIDEELNLENIIITAKYKNGKSLQVPCTADMVIGFDSKTSGDKSLYILYKGVKSLVKAYKVVNKGNETVLINTTCRLNVESEELPNAASYAFSLEIGDLSNVSAITFTLKSISDMGVAIDKMNLDITNVLPGWQAESYRVDKYTLKILVYKTTGLDINQDLSFATLNIIEEEIVTITANSITVSDGESDYYLPNIK